MQDKIFDDDLDVRVVHYHQNTFSLRSLIRLFFLVVLLGTLIFGTVEVLRFSYYIYNSLHPNCTDAADEAVFSARNPFSDEFIVAVNKKAITWKAGWNFPSTSTIANISRLMGELDDPVKRVDTALLPVKKHSAADARHLPESFDARTNWPHCNTIREIRDEGGCGNSWALGSVSSISDRYCSIKNQTVRLSAEDVLTCCTSCGDGCGAGYSEMAFTYWLLSGIVTGGSNNSTNGCRPYEIEHCEYHLAGNRSKCRMDPTPACVHECQSGSNLTYNEDKHYANRIYELADEASILTDLVINGPVQGSFQVYEDFLHYKSGIYQHVIGNYIGRHSIKVLGYGVDAGVPYYLCANSWNYGWGDGGFFKIERNFISNKMRSGIPA